MEPSPWRPSTRPEGQLSEGKAVQIRKADPHALGRISRTIAVMDRRRFLLGFAGGGAAFLGRAYAQDGPVLARLAIGRGQPLARYRMLPTTGSGANW